MIKLKNFNSKKPTDQQHERAHLGDQFGESVPKAVDFAKRFKWAILGFITFMLIAIVLAVNYSTKRTVQQTVIREIKTNSDASIAKIQEINAMNVPMVLLQNWALLINGQQYAIYQADNGHAYAKINGVNRPLKDGDVIYKDGKAYIFKNGKFVPLDIADGNQSPYHTGDLVYKDGKLYQVGADSKLHPYEGKLKPGQIVWRDGKAYVVGADGKLHPVGDHPTEGQFVMKDGKLYRVGADGKLHPYDGELKPGDIVWKDGKPYVVGADGKLHLIEDKPQPGDIVEKDGKLYQVGEDGKLYPYAGELAPGQVIWKDGKPYMVDENGHLVPLTEGMVHTIDGKPYVWKDGKWVPLSELGADPKHLVVKDSKLYEIGDDGKLILFKGKLRPGQIVWKDGVPYVVGDDGKLHKMEDGQSIKDKDGYRYIYKDQKLQREKEKKAGDNAITDTAEEARAGYDQSLMAAYKSSLVSFDGQMQAKDNAPAQRSPQDRVQEALNSQMTALREQAKAMSSMMTKGSDQYAQQNSQSSKAAFLKEDQSEPNQSDAQLQHPVSPYTLFAGSIIPATFETGINSDLPGTIIARVSRNVYDTRTGNYLLIPQGTKIMGKYDSQVAYGQERVLMVFTRLLFPNGTSIKLDNQPGADLRGFAGVTGDVNNHYWRIFGNALMFSVFGALGQLSQPSNDNSNGSSTSNQQVIYAAIGQQLTQTAAQMIAKNMNIQPTIKIQPGNNFSILTTRDIVFPSWYHFDNTGGQA